jgi:predicted ATPase/class 3 adenylate cyclase
MTSDAAPRRHLPTGTVTFLRTDVEGSMGLARALGPTWDAINATHLDILRDAVDRHDGVPVRTEGDAMFAAFPEAGAAVLAAIEAQRALTARSWPEGAAVRVRMGVHTGEAHLAGDDYGGFDVNRAARVAAVGHGGQIVVSGTTAALVASSLPSGGSLRDLGRHALRDVQVPEHLFQVEVPGLHREFPPPRVAGPVRGNLPERLTTFVGRAADLDALGALVDEHRLVTLTGPGGIGKTSLAIEFARARAATMPDGAWFVALDGVTEPGVVGSVIARTLGLFDGTERPAAETLPTFLEARALLLVLDNLEHLLEAAGEVSSLVHAAPRSRIVVTSRIPLRVRGEQEYPVRPLLTAADATEGEAAVASTRLFLDRARAVQPDWQAGPDGPVIAEICDLLDGLPLGIELAAARVSVMPVVAIRDRLAARLPLPGSGPRDAPARQRTLAAAIDWSHDLLSPAERRTLHALAVFEGGFDVDQAARVVDTAEASEARADEASALDRLVALAEQSLIARDLTPAGDAARLVGSGIRFGMLGTVQAYALGHLAADGDETAIRRRHAIAFLDLAETAAGHLYASGQPAWVDRLSLDRGNIQAALRWTIAADETELALRLVGALWRYWQLDGQLVEGDDWAKAALAMPGADTPSPARLAAVAAAGSIAYWRGDRARTVEAYREQLALAEGLADVAAMADARFNLASATYLIGDFGESVDHLAEARRLYVELGDDRGVNRVDWDMTNFLMATEGPAALLAALPPILERAVALDDAPYVVMGGGSMAWGHFMLGDMPAAADWVVRSLLGAYGLRDVVGTAIALPTAALVALHVGLAVEAAVIMGAFEGLCERYGARPPLGLATLIEQADPLERVAGILPPDELAAALDRGRRMTLDEAMDLVVRIGDALPPNETRT